MAAFDIPTLKEKIEHETVEKVLALDVDKYKYGFETDIESDMAPKGLNEDTVRFISAKKNEPEWMLEWRLEAYRRWLTMNEPTWAKVHYPKIDFQDMYYYAAPKKTGGPKSLADVDPALLEMYEKLGVPLQGARDPRRRRAAQGCRRCGDRLRLGGHHVPRRAGQGRHHLLLDRRGDPRAPRAGAAVPRLGRAGDRQLLCDAELGGLHRRLVLLHPQGRPLPDGALDLFPHQREEDRPVRAHADHRRRGQLCELPRGLHRADARGEPAPRRGGRARRAQGRRDQVLDGPELVSRATRTARAASTTSSPSAAIAGATTPRFSWTQVETGSAITWKYPSCILRGDNSRGEFYSIAISNGYQQVDSGTKMLHLGKNTTIRIISKGIAAGLLGQHLSRPGVGRTPRPRTRATSPSATAC